MVGFCQANIGQKSLSSNAIKIVMDGVPITGKDLAQLLISYFSSISTDLPCLDLCSLAGYLPAPYPVPIIMVEGTCAKMLTISAFKSHGPDGIPNRVIK